MFLLKTTFFRCVEEWMPKWQTNGWRSASKKPVMNQSELILLDEAIRESGIKVRFSHVYGHKGNLFNEEVDKLAKEGAKRFYQQKAERTD